MAEDIGSLVVKVGLDSSLFQDGVTGINKKMSLLKSEFSATSAQLKNFGSYTDQLKNKTDFLNKSVVIQEAKIKSLAEAYEKAKIETGENSKATQELGIKLNSSVAYLSKLQGELKRTSNELETQTSKWNNFTKGLEAASEKMKSFGNKINSIGSNLSMAVTTPIVGIGVAATKMAMDAVESENLFEVSMGNMANSARTWSEETSKALGLNAYAVRENVAVYNAMLTSMGLTDKESLNMSEGLTQLSYDMASFYNLKPEEAFEKLKAGISGESEPLKSLGVLVNDTTVQQYALANGIAKTTVNMAAAKKAAIDIEKAQAKYNQAVKEHGKNSLEARDSNANLTLAQQKYEKALAGSKVELTETEKVQARYGLIMQATTKAQGDLARTMDSPTNKLRIQKEQLTQTAIEIGTKLIPILNELLDAIKPAVDWFNNLSDNQKDLAIKIGLTAAAAGPMLKVFGTMAETIGTVIGVTKTLMSLQLVKTAQDAAETIGIVAMYTAQGIATTATKIATAAQWAFNVALDANPIGLVIIAIAALGLAIYEVVTHWKEICAWVKETWDKLKNNPIAEFIICLNPLAGALFQIIKHWQDICTWIEKAWKWLTTWNNTSAKPKEVNTTFGVSQSTGGYSTSFGVGYNASGNNNFQGGLTTLHERGYEVYDLPKGTRIYNHEASQDLAVKTAQEIAKNFIGSMNINSSGTQTIIVPVTLDGKEIARVVTPYSDKIQGQKLKLAGRGVGI